MFTKNEIYPDRFLNSRPFAFEIISQHLKNPLLEFNEDAVRKDVETYYDKELHQMLREHNASIEDVPLDEYNNAKRQISIIEKNNLYQMIEFYRKGSLIFDCRTLKNKNVYSESEQIDILRKASEMYPSVFLHLGIQDSLPVDAPSPLKLFIDGVFVMMSQNNFTFIFTSNIKELDRPINWYRMRDCNYSKILFLPIDAVSLSQAESYSEERLKDNLNPNRDYNRIFKTQKTIFRHILPTILTAFDKMLSINCELVDIPNNMDMASFATSHISTPLVLHKSGQFPHFKFY